MPYRINQGSTTECTVDYHSLEGLSLRYNFLNFAHKEEMEDIFDYLEKMLEEITNGILAKRTVIAFTLSAAGEFACADGTTTDAVISSGVPTKIYRHGATRQRKLRRSLFEIFLNSKFRNGEFEDSSFEQDFQEDIGSSLVHMSAIKNFTINFTFPYEAVGKSLSTSKRLQLDHRVSQFLNIPFNSDHFCILHTIFRNLQGNSKTLYKNLNAEKQYMKDFQEWFNQHNLGRFYLGENFLLDEIEELERELDLNLNLYTFLDNSVELFYRSGYACDSDPILLLLIPLTHFRDPRKKDVASASKPPVSAKLSKAVSDTLVSTSLKNIVEDSVAHCVELRPSFFRKQGDTSVCRWCTRSMRNTTQGDQSHEEQCLQTMRGAKLADRIKNFTVPEKRVKEFTRFDAMMRVPFVTHDWETVPVDGVHVPVSWVLSYKNVFNPTESKVLMSSSWDNPEELIESFLDGVLEMVKHHREMQSVDFPKTYGEIPEQCPLCHKASEKMENNHSHFAGDTLNQHLDTFICKACNQKLKMKTKGLKFFSHNGARFDHNLFSKELLNDERFSNADFIAKNETRFSQMSFSTAHGKVTFADSYLLLTDSLARLTEAWVGKADLPVIKSHLAAFYEDASEESIRELAEISLKKAVFPYGALGNRELLKQTTPLPRDEFYDELSRSEISDGDYERYLHAHEVLSRNIPDFNFEKYHDFYLLLDGVLLGIILFNAMQKNFELEGLNLLAFVSAPSFSFNSMLKHNLDNNVPEIVLPDVSTQLFLTKSIHGGFTFIFNRKNLRGKDDFTTYFDFTSMYPSAMSQRLLPHKHLESVPATMENLAEVLADEGHYYFLEVDIAPLDEKFRKRNSILPLFPGSFQVKPEMLSEDQRFRYRENGGSEFRETSVNTVTFFEKKNYVCSATYLREALALGYEISAVHRIEKFEQGNVMSHYINKLFKKKQDLTFRRDALQKHDPNGELPAVLSLLSAVKTQLNSIFGFTITNVSRQGELEKIDISQKDLLKKRISSLRFKSMHAFGETVLVNKMKNSYELSYPQSLGSAILWESKIMMIKFVYGIYEFLSRKSSELTLWPCMTDTDSYMFSIGNFKKHWDSIDQFTFEFNKEMFPVFDTSASAKEFQMPETHGVLGFVTNETGGKPITEYHGLCSKVYSFLVEGDEKETVKSKGITKAAKARYLNHALYGRVIDGTIFQENAHKADFETTQIRAKKIELSNISCRKRLVTLVDTKSRVEKNGIEYRIFG